MLADGVDDDAVDGAGRAEHGAGNDDDAVAQRRELALLDQSIDAIDKVEHVLRRRQFLRNNAKVHRHSP